MVPGSLARLTARAFDELDREGSVFMLPSRKFAKPDPLHDTSVEIHGRTAGAPLGVSAGPHTQLAQNILLGWLAGARVFELKTVQTLDSLAIPRPCIDARTVGYNVEWSQELKVEQSAEEYVKASMLIDMFAEHLGVERGCLFDLSVGYDFEGIRSDRMRAFMLQMIYSRKLVDDLRKQLPLRWRDLDFKTGIASTVTLSTFHGCPASEIESIAGFLMADMGLDCTIKLNPTLLGAADVNEILRERLGYADVHVPPSAFEKDPDWEQAVAIIERLQQRAKELGRRFAIKLTNTLLVENRSDFLPRSEKFAYLSGRPLHVLAMHLVQRFRRTFGNSLPISFSAGIDRLNYPDAVRLGLAPVTVCTDLLKQGGYGRLPFYATELAARMDAAGAKTIRDFARTTNDDVDGYVESLTGNRRYHYDVHVRAAARNARTLNAVACSCCDLCIGVCPNAAIITVPSMAARYQIVIIDDWCNDCGNCETFCPDNGAPNRVKPRFTLESLEERCLANS
ncbi:MAG: glutamate synthase [Thermoanaerobaculia bacterium]